MVHLQNLPLRATRGLLRSRTFISIPRQSTAPLPRTTGSTYITPLSTSSPRLHFAGNSATSTFGTRPVRLFSNAAALRKDKSGKDGSDGKGGKKLEGQESEVKEKEKDKDKEKLKEDKELKDKEKEKEDDTRPAKASRSAAASGKNAAIEAAAEAAASNERAERSSKSAKTALSKPSVPEIYPQVMCLPIARRPLFPGFYKAVTIKDPNVISAIQEMMKRGQPYLGAFLLKDEESDSDTIKSIDDVHPVGVFAQITSIAGYPLGSEEKGTLTAVLYPHRRIRISKLFPPEGVEGKDATTAEVTPEPAQPSPEEEKGDVVASFHEMPVDDVPSGPPSSLASSFLKKFNVSLVDVENLPDQTGDKKTPIVRAVSSEIVNVFKEIATVSPLFRDQISTFSMSQSAGNIMDEPGKLADFAAAVSAGETKELQEVLETINVEERLNKALVVLKKELMNAQLQSKIAKDVEAKIQKRQREYWLMEQMKGIRRELGIESDGKDKLVEKFKEKAENLAMPEAVKKVFDEELNKLAHLEPAASEFNVTRNYLDWLTQIPWGQRSAENYSIKNATTVLDEDHYGLQDVKDRILEFIAVGKLRGSVEGKILCFVGPPGVGKTSIGKSIARALNRQFYRFSVGGLTDVAEIKGHRRTYVGALPGRIIQALKKCQTENPLILIDEVDKIGRGHQGDPASALLELLDPEQNSSFLDHYMDVPVDLSKVLFVCTANMSDTIPRPLLDRMEMIELSGYVADEKMAIAEKYLAPQAKEMSGLKDVNVNLDKSAIEELIKSYCRESGVRNLKKQIEKVYRKAALKIINDLGEEALPEEKALTEEGKKTAEAEPAKQPSESGSESTEPPTTTTPRVALKVPDTVNVEITNENLKDFVGPPVFTSDRLYDITPPGVAMGLAWTRMGGAALYVESIIETALSAESRPGLERTGNLKDVMRESTSIAYSFAKSLMARKFPENRFFEKARIHLHCPEGAVPKDGPSAGITMATSLLSLALDTPIDPTISMTGELTVTGKVLRIGGLREKTVAAKRSGSKIIIFPQDNMSDWLELPENIKEGLEGKPVSWYEEVFNLVFKDLDSERASTLWAEQIKKRRDGDSKEKKESEHED